MNLDELYERESKGNLIFPIENPLFPCFIFSANAYNQILYKHDKQRKREKKIQTPTIFSILSLNCSPRLGPAYDPDRRSPPHRLIHSQSHDSGKPHL